MARDPKLEVSAINIRIPETHERNYAALIETLAEARRGVRVFGNSYVAISYFDAETKLGVFSKYTEIDLDGDWFDIDEFGAASAEQIDEVSIPENLRPNLSAFYFELNADLHVLAFSSYSDSKSLSARSVERYFNEALDWPEVRERFGTVESDAIKDYAEIERILDLPDLRELHLVIRTPNTDDMSDDLADIIERRLREQNADEYEEALKSRDKDSISPNERTKKLGAIAAENGEVRAKSLVNGVLTEHTTSEKPLQESTKYKPDEENERTVFHRLAARVYERVIGSRKAVSG